MTNEIPEKPAQPEKLAVATAAPTSSAAKIWTLSGRRAALDTEFRNARGLNEYEVRGMHFNRVSCSRRIFSPAGQSIEGDGDLKVTAVGQDFVEVEMPSHFSFVDYSSTNPFNNGISDVFTLTARQMFRVSQWGESRSLKLSKTVTVNFVDKDSPPKAVTALDEVKVVGQSYPNVYLVKETIYSDKPFSLYYFCD